MSKKLELTVQLILIVLLLSCLLRMPYTYYQLVRFLGFLGFGILGLIVFQRDKQILAFTYCALAILFQPFLKVSLGRDLWNVVDIFVAVFLVVTIFLGRSLKK